MRGLAGLVLLAMACSSSGGTQDAQGLHDDGGAGAMAVAGGPQAGASWGAQVAAGGPSLAGAASTAQAGSPHSAGAPAGGASGSAGQVETGGTGASGAAQGGANSAGAAQAGGPGASAGAGGAPANQCAGFTTYAIEAGACLSVTGDYQQQPDPACSPSAVVLRDHCSTCASWTAVDKPSTVMLAIAPEATLKRYDAPGGVCPSNCKYICK